MDVKELNALVDMLWNTTIVVDGTIRVKTLAISWNELSAPEQAAVIERLRQLLTAELKRLPENATLRLEFESIPKKLRAMLVDLAGEDNPDVTWGLISDEVPPDPREPKR
jgi:hypothetical protein